MKFTFSVSPNLRQKQSTKQIMFELMLALLVVFGFSLIYYASAHGMKYMMQALLLMAVSLVTTFVTEIAFSYFKRGKNKFDLAYVKKYLSGSFGWITAIILTLMCPISITPYALIVSTFFAIFFGKLLFGGFGHNFFNPAALGRAIVFATFMGAATDVVTSATPTGIVASEFNWLVCDSEMIASMMDSFGGLGNLFLGWYPGAIGETSTLVILLCGIYLAVRKVIDWRVPVVYLGSMFVFTAVIALMCGVGAYNGLPGFIWYPLVHVCIGGAAFGAVFMLTDPVTSPTSAQGRIIFALGASILTVLIRIKANLPEGCLYSILIMNMLTPMIETALDGKQLKTKKKAMIITAVVAALGLGTICLAASVVEPAKPAPAPIQQTIITNDSEVAKFASSITSQETLEDGSVKYIVEANGYAALNDETKKNIFEITVKDNMISEMVCTKAVDSQYIGDQIANADFLAQYVGVDLSAPIEIDALTGATISSRSSASAVEAVRIALGY